ncbi:MAG TPA: cupin domain-containing protein [Burkholderiales bacterium]|nr:cupin domain-containing protein [Burkholderiales bacterium]
MTRRIVTGHDARGRAIVLYDGPAPNVKHRPSGLVSTLLWTTDESPAEVQRPDDRAEREIGIPPPDAGSIFRIVDFPAGAKGEMHRTRSIDYAVVIEGEIYMLLPEGEVHLRAGDVLVQQATEHAWENRSHGNCRIAFILIDAKA